MKKKYNFKKLLSLVVLILLCFSSSLKAESTSYNFYIQFSDKNNSPYSLSNPLQYLSQRAIDRRNAFALTCDSTDLPVNSSYLLGVQNLGITIHSKSKWMNGATVIVSDSSKMNLVRSLPFVKWVQYSGKKVSPSFTPFSRIKSETTFDYGTANTQISQINGKFLHDNGYTGKNIHIGVIDAGFMNVNINPAFESLRLEERLLGTKDIVNPASNIYSEDAHGANVLSIMAGNLANQYLGTAPDASYWLIRTEYSPTEYLVETDYWCTGIEFADSVGVDIVNSSLGYTTFDDARMNFKYADMNGTVSRASRAANLASKKGIIVVISAGNDGARSWHYISSPADANGIVTVGAVDSTNLPSYFSSFGPSSDGRVKPEICAQGTLTAIINTNGLVDKGNGTSYSSPVLAGMMACYLQAAKKSSPPYNVESLIQNVFKSANQYNNPTAQKGYGIPNFQYATQKLPFFTNVSKTEANKKINLAYDNTNKSIRIWMMDRDETIAKEIQLFSMTGKLVLQQAMNQTMTDIDVSKLPKGIYAVCVLGNKCFESKKVRIE